MKKPHLDLERKLWETGKAICGIDEVGRGCFAGPLVAAGVILKPDLSNKELNELEDMGINDSKLLSSDKRRQIKELAQKFILGLSLQFISVDIINKISIGNANKLIFQKVAEDLLYTNSNIHFLTDCFPIPTVSKYFQTNIIRGDQESISIALASIIAKVERDTYMEKLSLEYPEYGFEKHKGYGTKFHRDRLLELGPTTSHRTQFIASYI